MHFEAVIGAIVAILFIFYLVQKVSKAMYELGTMTEEKRSSEKMREAERRLYSSDMEKVGFEAEFVARHAANMLNNMQIVALAYQYSMRHYDRIRQWAAEHEKELIEKGITFPASVDAPETSIFDYQNLVSQVELDHLLSQSGDLWRDIDRMVKEKFPERSAYDKNFTI